MEGMETIHRNSFQSKLEDLEKEAEILMSCTDIKQKYIFLRYCFDQKITHIMNLRKAFVKSLTPRKKPSFALSSANLIRIHFRLTFGLRLVLALQIQALVLLIQHVRDTQLT